MNGNPRWMLTCDKCDSEFPHSDVVDRPASLRDPFTGYLHKPEFPSEWAQHRMPALQEVFRLSALRTYLSTSVTVVERNLKTPAFLNATRIASP